MDYPPACMIPNFGSYLRRHSSFFRAVAQEYTNFTPTYQAGEEKPSRICTSSTVQKATKTRPPAHTPPLVPHVQGSLFLSSRQAEESSYPTNPHTKITTMSDTNDKASKRKAEAKTTGLEETTSKKSRPNSVGKAVALQKKAPVTSDYSDFGTIDPTLQARLDGVDPFGPGKGGKLSEKEKKEIGGSMFYGMQTQVRTIVPMAVKDREERQRQSAARAVCCDLLEEVIGKEPAHSVLFKNLRPQLGKKLSDDDKIFLVGSVFKGNEQHFDIEESLYQSELEANKPLEGNLERLLSEMEHYSVHIEDEVKLSRANSLAKEFLYSLRALTQEAEDKSDVFHSFVVGLLIHHANGVPGLYNGKPSST